MSSLMIIVPDRISDFVSKGEVVDRYYNPGNLFEDVHFLLVNDDRPDQFAMRRLVGGAKLTIHNLPAGVGTFIRSCGWRPALLRRWASPAVQLAAKLRPQLIRCHGNNLNAFLALEIKRALGVPYVISLHGNPDIDYNRGRLARTWQRKIAGAAIEAVEIATVRNADYVAAVYSPIVPYLEKHGVSQYEVIYNAVSFGGAVKNDYRLGGRVKAICVGRQESLQKDPSPIIEAVAKIPTVELTLIGDGDLHEALRALSARLGISDRVHFVRRMPNVAVLEQMAAADIYVYCSDNWEISKTCIEASLLGLPIVVNRRRDGLAEELIGDHVLTVDQSSSGYCEALQRLIGDDQLRDRLGRAAARVAHARWHPAIMERRYAEIYRKLTAVKSSSIGVAQSC